MFIQYPNHFSLTLDKIRASHDWVNLMTSNPGVTLHPQFNINLHDLLLVYYNLYFIVLKITLYAQFRFFAQI